MKNSTLFRMLTIVLSIFLTYPAVSAETLSIGTNFFEGQFTKSNGRILIKNANIFDGKSEVGKNGAVYYFTIGEAF